MILNSVQKCDGCGALNGDRSKEWVQLTLAGQIPHTGHFCPDCAGKTTLSQLAELLTPKPQAKPAAPAAAPQQ